jgi:hypothetical protein
MTRKPKRKASELSAAWTCPECQAQMLGRGPRCYTHNPTPEQRAANPDAYEKTRYVANVRDSKTIRERQREDQTTLIQRAQSRRAELEFSRVRARSPRKRR